MTKCSDFDDIFNSKSVAIIGASNSPLGGGGIFLNAMKDMDTIKIFPVNPKVEEISGLKCYPSVNDIPVPVDYAVIAVSAKRVPGVIEECIKKGIKGVQIFSSGFKEIGEDGAALEDEIRRVAKDKIKVIGPNCMGLYYPNSGLSFFPGSPTESGVVSFVSQSGRFATFIIMMGGQVGIKFNKIISFGNAAVLESTDFLEYLGDDPETKVIAAYIEGVKDGKRFFDVVKKISKKKPTIIWRGGRTDQGGRAAASHTGSLAGSSAIWEALYKQTGAIEVKSMEELLDTITAFINLPSSTGRRVSILTGGGGETVSSADACAEENLVVPPFTQKTKSRVAQILNTPGTIHGNPIDYSGMGFSPGILKRVIRAAASDENIDALVVLQFLGPGLLESMISPTIIQQFLPGVSGTDDGESMDKVIDMFLRSSVSDLIKTKKSIGKPLIAISPFGAEEAENISKLQEAGVPVYPTFERALRALSNFVDYYEFLDKA
ncbi:MAG: CoA-binding protein [Halobacteriota archaeon]|nr:CoA-binding protein [Halobacteriota archaeon]